MSATDGDGLLQRFWQELGEVRTGMLGIAADNPHSQPMTAHFSGTEGPIWFYARRDSDIVQSADGPQQALFHYASGGHDLFACVHGELTATDDPAAAARFWDTEVANWFPGGEDDPDLIMLRFDPSRAQIWLPKNGPNASVFGFGTKRAEDIRAQVQL